MTQPTGANRSPSDMAKGQVGYCGTDALSITVLWLNHAEIEVSLLSRQCLGKRTIGEVATVQNEVRAWGRRLNRNETTIEWSFTRKLARRKLYYSLTRTRYSEKQNILKNHETGKPIGRTNARGISNHENYFS